MKRGHQRRRTYDATGRRRRALETRERILEAARRLFAEQGYSETTLGLVAARAEVSLATVYAAFRSKKGLALALIQRLAAGVPGEPDLLRTAGPRRVLAEPSARRMLALLVADLGRIHARVVPMYEVLVGAARAEPDLGPLLDRLQAERLANLRSVTDALARRRALREGLTREQAAWTLWALASPELHRLFHRGAGWSEERYRAWLEDALGAALLSPRARRGADPKRAASPARSRKKEGR